MTMEAEIAAAQEAETRQATKQGEGQRGKGSGAPRERCLVKTNIYSCDIDYCQNLDHSYCLHSSNKNFQNKLNSFETNHLQSEGYMLVVKVVM